MQSVLFTEKTIIIAAITYNRAQCEIALFPGLHAQLLSLAVRKAGGRPGRIYHMMRAAADVT